ncbi:MAG TPA: DUF192 domain-containing protein [Nitrososphaera sp.]|nr:DUF192 domain-containing protein [Nitrososphaera sp.]
MQTITVIAIVAAAAAGIIAAAVIFYPGGYIGSLDWAASELETEQQELVVGGASPSNNGYMQVNITVNGVELVADIAANSTQKSKGLSVKDALKENEAMLFLFDTEREHSFWMKNMKFPIDIIWLDEDKEVVHVEHSLEPCIGDLFCQSYKPDDNSLYVLETVAGFAQKYNVTENTYVEFELD